MKISKCLKDFTLYTLVFPTCVLLSIILMFIPFIVMVVLCLSGEVLRSFSDASIFLLQVSLVCFVASISFYSLSRLTNFKVVPNWINKYKSRLVISLFSYKGDRRVEFNPVQLAQALSSLHKETNETRFALQVCYLNKHIIYDHFDPIQVVNSLQSGDDFFNELNSSLLNLGLKIKSFESKWWWYPSSRIEIESCSGEISTENPTQPEDDVIVYTSFTSKRKALSAKSKVEGNYILIGEELYTYTRKVCKDGYKRWAVEKSK